MAAYTVHDSSFFSRRAIVFIVACAMQVVIFIALDYGLVNKVIKAPPAPIQTNIVQQQQKKVAPPPPPPPKMQRPPVQVPPPEVAINVPQETHSTAITNVTTKKAPPPPPPKPRPVVRTPVTFARGGRPSTAEFYPPVSRRLDEQGTAIVQICPGPGGRLSRAPTIVHSSGSSRLDQAALRYARAARFRPATVNGKPVVRCVTLPVKFVLMGGD